MKNIAKLFSWKSIIIKIVFIKLVPNVQILYSLTYDVERLYIRWNKVIFRVGQCINLQSTLTGTLKQTYHMLWKGGVWPLYTHPKKKYVVESFLRFYCSTIIFEHSFIFNTFFSLFIFLPHNLSITSIIFYSFIFISLC